MIDAGFEALKSDYCARSAAFAGRRGGYLRFERHAQGGMTRVRFAALTYHNHSQKLYPGGSSRMKQIGLESFELTLVWCRQSRNRL